MAGDLVLIDSNVLIRWVQPEGVDFQVVTGSIRSIDILRDIPCFTSQNLGEFWNVLTRPADRNGYGLTPEEALLRAEKVESKFRLLSDSLKFTPHGEKFWLTIVSQAFRCMTPALLPQCMSTASSASLHSIPKTLSGTTRLKPFIPQRWL